MQVGILQEHSSYQPNPYTIHSAIISCATTSVISKIVAKARGTSCTLCASQSFVAYYTSGHTQVSEYMWEALLKSESINSVYVLIKSTQELKVVLCTEC